MINKGNILLSIFSFNRTHELETLLESIRFHNPGFDILLIDDASTLPATHRIISENRDLFKHVIKQPPCRKTTSRGRLPQNIQFAFEFADQNHYDYVFFIQDDMQFVRPLDETVLSEYDKLFASDEKIIQVDPRFLRRLGEIRILPDLHAYSFCENDDRSSYADVGITHIQRLKSINWTFETRERTNKEKAHSLHLRRIFPFTPIFMHVPYPVMYRKGRVKLKFPSPFIARGKIKFENLTPQEMKQMDERPLEIIPYARDLLRVEGLGLVKWHYLKANENNIYC